VSQTVQVWHSPGRPLRGGLRRTAFFHARIEKGWTLSELSNHTGIAVSALHWYDIGRSLPRVDNAIKLAEVLDTTVEMLFKGAL
jgi:transcriptional regulator with XRE-family HTH domain